MFEYEVSDPTGRRDLAQLRSIQDWYLRYQLQTVPGVSEVASVGGFVKQYQVVVDPNTLASYRIPLSKVRQAIIRSNNDVGGRVIENSETEYMVRGLGYVKGIKDLENIVVGVDSKGTPVLIKDVAMVRLGPELRRGLTEANGKGEVVGGIVDRPLRGKRPGGHRRRQAEIGGTEGRPAARGDHHHGLRPLQSHQSGRGESDPQAHRGKSSWWPWCASSF